MKNSKYHALLPILNIPSLSLNNRREREEKKAEKQVSFIIDQTTKIPKWR